ncbi:hypothetical protein BDR26DRAFT_623180 [Obelidium mucronatum]|nr:hypothetical protein BDR26DRAFT_623180 [Obelidium mucronatum]
MSQMQPVTPQVSPPLPEGRMRSSSLPHSNSLRSLLMEADTCEGPITTGPDIYLKGPGGINLLDSIDAVEHTTCEPTPLLSLEADNQASYFCTPSTSSSPLQYSTSIHRYSHSASKPYVRPWPYCRVEKVEPVMSSTQLNHQPLLHDVYIRNPNKPREMVSIPSPPRHHSAPTVIPAVSSVVYRCDWANCSKVFKTQWHFTAHLNAHSNVKRFHCEYCHLTFSRMHDMLMHERRFHGAYTCGVCTRKGFDKEAFLVHLKGCL